MAAEAAGWCPDRLSLDNVGANGRGVLHPTDVAVCEAWLTIARMRGGYLAASISRVCSKRQHWRCRYLPSRDSANAALV